MLRFSVLASSSKGNCVVVEAGSARLLLDAGISFKKIKEGCALTGLDVKKELDAVFISHEHSDHNRACRMIEKHTFAKIVRPEGMEHGQAVRVKDATITPFMVRHDEDLRCYGFSIEHVNHKFVYISDFSCLPEESYMIACDPHVLFIEFNYDEDMLLDSPYSQDRIERVADTHCMNGEAVEITNALGTDNLQWLIPFHVSETNNDPFLVTSATAGVNTAAKIKIKLAETNGWNGVVGVVL